MKRLLLIAFAAFLAFPAKSQVWDSLRGGLGNAPRILYADTFDNYMYVTGQFLEVDGHYAKGIARWNGTQWDTLGRGIDGLDTTTGGWPQNCFGITRYNNELYVGGTFFSAGTAPAFRIAKWDGFSWDTLDTPPFRNNSLSTVQVLENINGELYMGGTFDTVAGNFCKSVAKWNGASWVCIGMPSNISPSPSVRVNAICAYNNEVYFAGNFSSTAFPSDTIMDIVRYDGSNWKSVGGGMHGTWADVSSMVVYNGELYVAGYFFASDGNAGNHIQKWNGTNWSDVGGGTGGQNGQIHKLVVHNGKLYAMGVFDFAGGIPASKFASWDGMNWCGVGSIFDNTLNTACVYNDTLYIGGGFWTIDGDSVSRIAQWVGGNYADTCGNTTSMTEAVAVMPSVTVFPNPATDRATFQFTAINGQAVLRLYDGLGREVWSETTNGTDVIFSTAGHPAGLYFYRLEQDGEILTSGKLIVQ